MHAIHRTLDALKAALDLPALDLDANGQVELAFSGDLVVHLTRAGDDAIEFSVRLPGLDSATPAMMRAMLGANLLGGATGAGRLALDVVKDEVVYCERWLVADLDAAAVERRLAGFLETAAYWLTEGTGTLVEETAGIVEAPAPAAATSPDAYMFRL